MFKEQKKCQAPFNNWKSYQSDAYSFLQFYHRKYNIGHLLIPWSNKNGIESIYQLNDPFSISIVATSHQFYFTISNKRIRAS
ncbi:hypothetical protein [Neobacillus drentensis]|uniref:hypothetical protein n=1 Tax=Neobacillus drentensis TaxID=220684 RepID=UPI002FFE76B1